MADGPSDRHGGPKGKEFRDPETLEGRMRFGVALAMITLTFAVFVQAAAYRGLDEQRQVVSEMAAQYVRSESWLGRPFPLNLSSDSLGRWSLVWIVDPARCSDCSTDVGNWNLLATPSVVRTAIILDAQDPSLDPDWMSWIEAEMIGHEPGALQKVFEVPTPSLRFLLNPDGLVVDVDARPPDSTCRWSFSAKVDLILSTGLNIPFTGLYHQDSIEQIADDDPSCLLEFCEGNHS